MSMNDRKGKHFYFCIIISKTMNLIHGNVFNLSTIQLYYLLMYIKLNK